VTIAVGSSLGMSMALDYQVFDPAKIGSYIVRDGGEVYFNEPGKIKQSPVVVKLGQNDIEWHTTNPQVVTVTTNGVMTSQKKGASIVWGSFTDKWGVYRDIMLLVGVGMQLGDSDLGELIELINKAEDILAKQPNPYTDGSLGTLEDARDNGKLVINMDNPSDQEIKGAIDDLKDALAGLTLKEDGGGTSGGDKYFPVGVPANVYEVMDENGNSKQPPEYVYNPDNPENGGNRPAKPDDKGGYWVEDPEGSNIWKQVEPDGSLSETDVIWGGPDGKFGGKDDTPVTKFDDGYWVDMGQNVWCQVETPTTLGPYTGGGPDGNPATDNGRPVYKADNDQFFIGPLDKGGDEYYYGDPLGGNTLLDSIYDGLKGDDVIYYRNSDGTMTTDKPKGPANQVGVTDKNSVVKGQILYSRVIGDTSDWLEIARNGDYSLIVRLKYINVSTDVSKWTEPYWQNAVFGTDNNYLTYDKDDKNIINNVRSAINAWFTGAGSGNAEKLGDASKLRDYTVANTAADALYSLGKGCEHGSWDTGFSNPIADAYNPDGNDVAFALSYGEAAGFFSRAYAYINDPDGITSSDAAETNFDNLRFPKSGYPDVPKNCFMWLRSPGPAWESDTASALFIEDGKVYKKDLDDRFGYVYPALWVHKDIFDLK
jgi:hypothetical protein